MPMPDQATVVIFYRYSTETSERIVPWLRDLPLLKGGGSCSLKEAFLWGYVQGSSKRRAPGLVNFVPAVAYHFCLNLPAAFSQPGARLILEPCTYCIFLAKLINQIINKERPTPQVRPYKNRSGGTCG